jgi:hypothetical protein
MSKQQAQQQALEQALTALADVDLERRLPLLGLPTAQDGRVPFRLFAQDALLDLSDLAIRLAASGAPAKLADRILVLHYLMHEGPVARTERLVSFHEFPGGSFYFGPFRTRTVEPLVKRFGNDLDALRTNLGRWDATPVPQGDLGACLHAFGPLYLTLIYQRGDEEFGPTAEVLFDAAALRVFGTEDAAVLASRICIGLL